MTHDLHNNVAIISGGLGDIGVAIALKLARRGADIALGDILPEDSAAKVLLQIEQLGRRACYHRVDVADSDAVDTWVRDVEQRLQTPTLIIPGAATATLKSTFEMSAADWTREISINLNGAFYLAQRCATQLFNAKRTGHIVFIGSWAADRPHQHIPAYSASKAALRMLMKCMALDYAPHVLVNEVAPGYVNAGLSGKMFEADHELRERARQRVPLKRLIEPHEVAEQVAHLCDPNNRHMTGSVLTMDGGLSQLGQH